jgi:putative PIN family toxin of toxin-antitoxin system
MITVVLDANVIISGIIAPRGASAAILDAWRQGYIEVVTCPGLIGEVAEKLALPRIREKYGLADGDIQSIVIRLSQAARVVPGQIAVSPAPPDPDDSMVVAAALEGNAQFIVTGDKGLLKFGASSPCPTVSPRQFAQESLPRSGDIDE